MLSPLNDTPREASNSLDTGNLSGGEALACFCGVCYKDVFRPLLSFIF